MSRYRRDPEWEWHVAEACHYTFMEYSQTGRITIERPFLLLLFSMFFDDMVAWCNNNPQLASFHAGRLGFFSRLKYLGYGDKLVLETKNETVGVVFFNDVSNDLKSLAETLLSRHQSEFPDITVDIMFDAANRGVTLYEARESHLKRMAKLRENPQLMEVVKRIHST